MVGRKKEEVLNKLNKMTSNNKQILFEILNHFFKLASKEYYGVGEVSVKIQNGHFQELIKKSSQRHLIRKESKDD